jgi:subtilisin family serine protease
MTDQERPREDRPEGGMGELSGERELVVIARQEAALRAAGEEVASAAGADTASLSSVLTDTGVSMRPLFGATEERLRDETASLMAESGMAVPDLSVFYRVEAPDERLDELAERLREEEVIEAAYVKPPAVPPQELNEMVPVGEEPAATPDFAPRQLYLDAAPGGIDARFAWTQPGGRGAGVRIIDIEGAWRFTHEDLTQGQGGVIGGTQNTDLRWRNHGTAVVGEFGGDRNGFGIEGISPDANVRAISIFGPGMGSAAAIRQAALALGQGDIILIELHRPGPRFDFQDPQGQRGFIAIEWWEDDFAAISFATGRGVVVVEAAGNGSENLDDPLYSIRPAGFPATWTNPFNRANRDSGAILVGAGAPPQGTHGRDHGPDRSRLDFSNFGSAVDAQGWGREVTSAGYGDLQGGSNEDFWYTDMFSGTSSASPIVVGALACVQGNRRARGVAQLTPAAARQRLRTTGSPQQDAPGRPRTQRIGNRPNLRQLLPTKFKEKEFKELKAEKSEIKEGKPEIKEGKPEVKELKEKEFKEIKPEIEGKNVAIDKGPKESIEGPPPTAGVDPAYALGLLAQRLDELERRLSGGQAFIQQGERPDLGAYAFEDSPGQPEGT